MTVFPTAAHSSKLTRGTKYLLIVFVAGLTELCSKLYGWFDSEVLLMSVLQPERIAIIGGGCTGTTCFWALQHTTHDVHLFEASAALGGRIKEYRLEHNGNKTTVNTEMPSFNAAASRQCSNIPCDFKLTTSSS
ncbi:hypothetical protein BDV59DRAFT_61268 [Aspergillus ambiguus]|uniref:uncharacterized protein n=1 Tax=Aspergillus ambiguus TaxID=176160 RepID=UPI003CCE4F30